MSFRGVNDVRSLHFSLNCYIREAMWGWAKQWPNGWTLKIHGQVKTILDYLLKPRDNYFWSCWLSNHMLSSTTLSTEQYWVLVQVKNLMQLQLSPRYDQLWDTNKMLQHFDSNVSACICINSSYIIFIKHILSTDHITTMFNKITFSTIFFGG